MKIQLNDKDKKELDEILTMKDQNIEVSELINSFLIDNFDLIKKEQVNELSKEEALDKKDAVESIFLNYLNLDKTDAFVLKMEKDNDFAHLYLQDKSKYRNNLLNQLSLNSIKAGQYELTYNYFEPYELFNLDEVYADKSNCFAEHTKVGYFEDKVKYLILKENNQVWMSVTPHEINTMSEHIKNATGRVLTFGLGLGYYAYEVSNKDDVSEVVIVEKDNKVIQLFTKYILPSFKHKEKIKIIKENAFLYFDREYKQEHFNYSFIDIYHTPDDALFMYLKFKQLEKKNNYTNINYWIEESILCLLRRYVLVIIEEYYQGLTADDYQILNTEEDKILLALFNALKNKTFTSIDEINYLLSDEGLKELAKNTLF